MRIISRGTLHWVGRRSSSPSINCPHRQHRFQAEVFTALPLFEGRKNAPDEAEVGLDIGAAFWMVSRLPRSSCVGLLGSVCFPILLPCCNPPAQSKDCYSSHLPVQSKGQICKNIKKMASVIFLESSKTYCSIRITKTETN